MVLMVEKGSNKTFSYQSHGGHSYQAILLGSKGKRVECLENTKRARAAGRIRCTIQPSNPR